MKRMISRILLVGMLLSSLPCGGAPGSSQTAALAASSLDHSEAAAVETADAYQIQSIKIAGTDLSSYVIVQPDENSECLNNAASELSSYIEKASGIRLEIVPSSAGSAVIELGLDSSLPHNEAFRIKTAEGKLTITGGSERGCLYGVYEFLESYIGWRFLTVDCEVLMPESDTIEIPDGLDDMQEPEFDMRGIWTYEAYYGKWNADQLEAQQDYWAKRHINRSGDLVTEKQGGGLIWSNNIAVHTMEHLAGGVSQDQNPCMTDESVFETVLANVYKWLESDEKPADYISVSQNDNMSACNCENCTRVKEEEGSDAGPLIRFVNRIAEAVAEDYPDLLVHTLAYNATAVPPEVTKARDNVVVQYCTYQCCYQHALNDPECDEYGGHWGIYYNNVERANAIRKWESITNHLYIWDYGANFNDEYVFLPNFDVMLENCRFYLENDAEGVFLNGDWNYLPEFNGLRTYLTAKIYWNPNMSDEEYNECIDDFMKGYYGDGWKGIRQYLDYMQESSNARGLCFVHTTDSSNRLFRSLDIVRYEEEFTQMFADAKAAVEGDAKRIKRIYDIEQTYQYLLLSSRYWTDYTYGSETVRAEYQAKTKALYDKLSVIGNPNPPEYDPDVSPIGWWKRLYDESYFGNQFS